VFVSSVLVISSGVASKWYQSLSDCFSMSNQRYPPSKKSFQTTQQHRVPYKSVSTHYQYKPTLTFLSTMFTHSGKNYGASCLTQQQIEEICWT